MSPPDKDREERFEVLVGSVYVPIQRYLRRRTDAASADDVLGDVLLVMWRRIEDIPADATLAWSYGVARGCLANNARGAARQRRLVRRLSEEATRGETAPPQDPDLEEALAALPENDREVLRLWAWEQLAPREIAVSLGISSNAASIRLHRATRRLRKKLPARKDARPAGHSETKAGTEAPQ